MYTVVIVDDSALFRREVILTTPWEKMGCTVVGLAEDGVPGFSMIKDLKPDIVISDVKMIKMDGIEMIRKLKSNGCKSRFIVVSAYSEFDYAVEALKMQVDDYILKPISDKSLQDAIMKSVNIITREEDVLVKTFDDATINSFYQRYHEIEALIANNDANTYIVNATLFIKEHYYAEDISVSLISRKLEISESYLIRLFRQKLQITFNEYLTQYRMYKSLELLGDYSSTIYIVASEVGYSDYRYFAKVFKRTFDMNPSDFKSKYNKV